ncbi:hypothetical protein J6590_055088 [Homalodisca vitripennis]|nr:hypothetical protein J6590_055088 [Homalodisca vitripennis]
MMVFTFDWSGGGKDVRACPARNRGWQDSWTIKSVMASVGQPSVPLILGISDNHLGLGLGYRGDGAQQPSQNLSAVLEFDVRHEVECCHGEASHHWTIFLSGGSGSRVSVLNLRNKQSKFVNGDSPIFKQYCLNFATTPCETEGRPFRFSSTNFAPGGNNDRKLHLRRQLGRHCWTKRGASGMDRERES